MKRIWQLFVGDLKRLRSNVVTGIIVLGLIALPSIFSWYNMIAAWDVFGNTGNLKIAVASVDEGYESDLVPVKINVGEQVISSLRANDQIKWVFTDKEDAIDGAKSGKYYAAVVIPESFSRDITKGVQTHVTIYCDMSGMLYYKAMLTANTNASLVMNKQIKIERSGNTTIRQDEVSTSPIAYEDISIFNPQNGFASFLIPAVLILIIQQTLLLGVGLSAGTARENNRFRDLIPMSRHYHGTLRIVLGKSLTYLMIYAVMATYMLCLVPKMFSLVQIAQAGTLAAFMFPYILACIFFAMTCSIFIHHREACMMIYVFTSVPLLFISGISWPGTAIPKFWEVVSWLFPSTFGINGFVRINNMGATLTDVLTEYRVLWIQTGVYFLTTCIVYRRQITLSRRHVYERLKEIKKRRRTNVV